MENIYLKRSIRMAFAVGIFLPALETVRRIHQILVPEYFFRWFDDYTLGFVLLFTATLVCKNESRFYIPWLTAAWGIAAGALGVSLFGQLDGYVHGIADAGIFSSWLVTLAKALILLYILTGLRFSIKAINTVV